MRVIEKWKLKQNALYVTSETWTSKKDYRKSPLLESMGRMASTQVSHPETY